VWAVCVVGPWLGGLARRGKLAGLVLRAGTTALVLATLLEAANWASVGLSRFDSKVRPAHEVSTEGERLLQQFLTATPGRTLFAFADYPHRPITIDAAIHRGGMTFGDTFEWTDAYVRAMFPDRMYVLGPPAVAARQRVSLSRFQKLVYTYNPAIEDDASALATVERLFNFRADGFTCSFEYRFWDSFQPDVMLTNVQVARGCARARRSNDEATD
jgi:hypothetical protein